MNEGNQDLKIDDTNPKATKLEQDLKEAATVEGWTAKARLVLLGYQDPELSKIQTASPTLGRATRSVLLSMAAHNAWPVRSLDARAAFLSGETNKARSRPLYMTLPKTWAEELGLPSRSLFRLIKSAYGLAEAPRAWFDTLCKALKSIGFRQSYTDPCAFTLPPNQSDWKEWRRQQALSASQRRAIPKDQLYPDDFDNCACLGGIGVHVDDLLMLGSHRRFSEKVRELQKLLPFGSLKSGALTFTGVEISQASDGTIYVGQPKYAKKLEEVVIKDVSFGPKGIVTKSGETKFRAVIGALLWLSVQTRPDLAFDVSYWASHAATATRDTFLQLNKCVRRAKQQADLNLVYRKVVANWGDLRCYGFSDAGEGSRKSGLSQAGSVVLLGHKSGLDGAGVRGLLLDSRSDKITRACRSSFRAELEAMQSTVDLVEALSFQIEDLSRNVEPLEWLRTYGRTSDARAVIIDAKGLYEGLRNEKKPSPTGERGRLATWILLRQNLASLRVAVYWVNSEHMLADAMTKLSEKCPGAHVTFRTFLKTGTFRISYDALSARRTHQQRLGQPPIAEEEVDEMSEIQNRHTQSYQSMKLKLHTNRWKSWE